MKQLTERFVYGLFCFGYDIVNRFYRRYQNFNWICDDEKATTCLSHQTSRQTQNLGDCKKTLQSSNQHLSIG